MTAVPFVQPSFRLNYTAHPIGYVFPVSAWLRLWRRLDCEDAIGMQGHSTRRVS